MDILCTYEKKKIKKLKEIPLSAHNCFVFKFLKLIKKCSFPYNRTHLSTPYRFIV